MLAITHYSRLLHELRPDVVHVLVKGRILATGGPELADELERTGYAAFLLTYLQEGCGRTFQAVPRNGDRRGAVCGAVLLWPRSTAKVAAAAVTTTTTRPATTTTVPPPAHSFEAADPVGAAVALYDSPGATESTGSLPNPTVEKVPLAFLVKAHGPPRLATGADLAATEREHGRIPRQ